MVYTTIPFRRGSETMIKNDYIPPVYIQIRDILIDKINSGEFKKRESITFREGDK